MKKLLLTLCLLASALLPLASQNLVTKVRGVVTDADSGEPVPFAAVFFKGTQTGLTADIDGRYSLETRDRDATVLICQLLGYDTVEKEVRYGVFTEVNFKMHLTDNRLSGAIVKADDRKIRLLLANIEAHRDRNDPEQREWYSCEVYNKMELDLTHAKEQLQGPLFPKEFNLVFEYMDTSSVSGVPYLPTLMSETILERRHRGNPLKDNETIVANRISGINPKLNLLSQFTGSMYFKSNFYKPFVNCMNLEFPSPSNKNGLLYYNYFIVDSLQMDGRKTYVVRYHPKPGVSTPALDGEMRIDAEEFALRSVRAKMMRGGNVNWLRDIVIENDYQRLADSTWFFKQDKLYADFSIALEDSTKMVSVLGNRLLSYDKVDFSPVADMREDEGMVKVLADANFKDEAYWEANRPVALTDSERKVYDMIADVQETNTYKWLYRITYALVDNYWNIGPIGIGPLTSLYSNSSLEGPRPQIGIHTSKELSDKFRSAAIIAYGFKDKEWKWKLSHEQIFQREPQRKLTAEFSYEAHQLGKGLSSLTNNNILSSFWGKSSRPIPYSELLIRYDHEFNMQVNGVASISLKRYHNVMWDPTGPKDASGNHLYPAMYALERWDGTHFNSIATNELRLKLRLSWEETVNRGRYTKSYVYSDYPVVSIDLQGSVPGLRNLGADDPDIGYFMPQLHLEWQFRVPPLGKSLMYFRSGAIIGQVPWTLLNLYSANNTMMTDNSAFSCMDYCEFASDTWAYLLWYHSFGGFFLGKIPLINKLQLREELTAKVAYGGLRDENNGLRAEYGAMTRFPFNTRSLDGVPYVELGVGLSNIFRMFRIDFTWRVTHRERVMLDHEGYPVTDSAGNPVHQYVQPLWNLFGLIDPANKSSIWGPEKASPWIPNAINIGMDIRF